MKATTAVIGSLSLCWILAACSPPAKPTAQGPTSAPSAPPAFVNRVWKVAESTGMTPGQLVVFLSEGTLVFASTNGTPAFGTWTYDGKDLTMVEESIPYRVEILALTDAELRLRSHNPGGFVETRFVPAEEPLPAAAAASASLATDVRFVAPASRSGRLVSTRSGMRFVPCGESGEGIAVEAPDREAASLLSQLGAGASGVTVMARFDSGRLAEIRYAGLEGPSCDRLPPEGDVEARGNEPFWMARVTAAEAVVRTPEKPDGVAFGGGSWTRQARGWRFSARRSAGGRSEDLVLEIAEERCVDSMSGARYPYRAVLTQERKTMDGCALEGRGAIPAR